VAQIEELSVDDLDENGLPLYSVTIIPTGAFYPIWIAHCEEIPGYFGGGSTQAEALNELHQSFLEKPIYRVKNIPRMRRNVYKVYSKLAELGGSDAASEALKQNGAPLGVSPNDLFQTRKSWRAIEAETGKKMPPERMIKLVHFSDSQPVYMKRHHYAKAMIKRKKEGLI